MIARTAAWQAMSDDDGMSWLAIMVLVEAALVVVAVVEVLRGNWWAAGSAACLVLSWGLVIRAQAELSAARLTIRDLQARQTPEEGTQ